MILIELIVFFKKLISVLSLCNKGCPGRKSLRKECPGLQVERVEYPLSGQQIGKFSITSLSHGALYCMAEEQIPL